MMPPVRRVRRILINAPTILSLLLCVGTCVLWGRSYSAAFKGKSRIDVDGASGIISDQKEIALIRGDLSVAWLTVIIPDRSHSLRRGLYFVSPALWSLHPRGGPPTANISDRRVVFIYHGRGDDPQSRAAVEGNGSWVSDFEYSVWAVSVPCWLLTSFTALPAAFLVRRFWIRQRNVGRLRNAYCPTCGYDLRATPDRCPECGAVPKRAVAPVLEEE